jgi:hypothetical protein
VSTASPAAQDQIDSQTQLAQLAVALTQRGYDATLITPAPYLAVRVPGATLPQMIYNTGGQFWWHSAQTIAPSWQTALAAEMIAWALRAHPHQPATDDTTSPLATAPGQFTPPQPAAGRGGGQGC